MKPYQKSLISISETLNRKTKSSSEKWKNDYVVDGILIVWMTKYVRKTRIGIYVRDVIHYSNKKKSRSSVLQSSLTWLK